MKKIKEGDFASILFEIYEKEPGILIGSAPDTIAQYIEVRRPGPSAMVSYAISKTLIFISVMF